MMRKFYFLLGILVFGVSAAQAQMVIGVGPRLGGNLATGTFSTLEQSPGFGSYSYTRSPIIGYQVGLAASFGWGHWVFQPALLLTEKGLKQHFAYSTAFAAGTYTESEEATSRVHYLELPLDVVYSFGPNGEGFQLFAGPYVAAGVGGTATYQAASTLVGTSTTQHMEYSDSQALTFGNTFPEPSPAGTAPVVQARVRRFDAGLTAGVGYRRGPYQAQLGYGLGLLNVQPNYSVSYQQPNNTGYLRTTQLMLSYYFPVGVK